MERVEPVNSILLSAYACEPQKGSEAGNGWNWAVHLAEAGYCVHVLTRIQARAKIESHGLQLSGPFPTFHFVELPNWVTRLCAGRIGMYLKYMLWQRAAYKTARSLNLKFDVVHHVTWGSLIGGSHLWNLGCPFVFGPIGGGQVAPAAFSRYCGSNWKSEAFRSLMVNRGFRLIPSVRNLVRHSNVVLATNEETYLLAQTLGAKRTLRFSDTGLPESYFPRTITRRSESNEIKALWVGRILPWKGLNFAIEAFAKTKSNITLTVVGDGPQRAKVVELSEKLNIANRIDWKGQLGWEECRHEYAVHDLFFFPTLRDSSPAQLLESMAFGLPIVTLDMHGSRALVPEDAGIRVEVTEPTETGERLARALDFLANTPSARKAMGRAGRTHAQEFVWSNKINEITSIYEQVVSDDS